MVSQAKMKSMTTTHDDDDGQGDSPKNVKTTDAWELSKSLCLICNACFQLPGFHCLDPISSMQANKQANKQATKQVNKQANKHVNKRASR